MAKVAIFLCLFALNTGYSVLVYTKGTQSKQAFSVPAQTQFRIIQMQA
jgi:hypothetical protein